MLVDLAGSQRSGAERAGMAEAKDINKSNSAFDLLLLQTSSGALPDKRSTALVKVLAGSLGLLPSVIHEVALIGCISPPPLDNWTPTKSTLNLLGQAKSIRLAASRPKPVAKRKPRKKKSYVL